MTYPTIHLNGTSLKALQQQADEASEALQVAIKVLADMTPNGRDYYPQGPDAHAAALSQHRDAMTCMREALAYVAKIGEYLAEEELRRAR